jgi:hypothetical protein
MTYRTVLLGVFAFVVMLFLSASAHAQLFRAYLAPGGNDANPCTLPAPCRLLSAALAAVADGGEIWMLASANYNTGPVNIAKSVTILAVPGALGSVLAVGGNAINIATVGVKVALRNLVIVPFLGGGGTGVYMTNGAGLTVENCLIANLRHGIFVDGVTSVQITDTTIRDSSGNGLWLSNGARGTVTRAKISENVGAGVLVEGTAGSATTTTADIADSKVDGNYYGVYALPKNPFAEVKVSVHDSRVVRNANFGVLAQASTGPAVTFSVSNNIISNNGAGIAAYYAGSKVWASGNTVSDNVIGILNNTGLIESAGNNAVRNNGADTTGTIAVAALR